MRKLLTGVARKLTRPKHETAQLGDWSSTIAKYLMLGAVLGSVLGFFVPFLTDEIDHWKSGRPTILISKADWKVLYRDAAKNEKCEAVATANPLCFANPARKDLWTSTDTKTDSQYAQKIEDRKNKQYWLGLTVAEETLKAAAKIEAFHFILGKINSDHRIWINGELVQQGSKEYTSMPIVLDIPASKIIESKPLSIAIEVFNNSETGMPDEMGGEVGEGFATAKQVQSYMDRVLFWQKSGPWLFFGLNLVIGLFFLSFWSSSKKKQEYAYLGCFALLAAMIHLFKMDLLQTKLSYAFNIRIQTALQFYHGAFGLFLGLAFSRTRRVFFQAGIPIIGALPWLLFSAGPRFFSTSIAVFYCLGASICFLQAYWLAHERHNLTCLPIRLRRLAGFGAGILFLGLNHIFLRTQSEISVAEVNVWYYLVEFIGLLFLSAIMLKEFREAERMSLTAPVSEYHRRPVLPEGLSGIVTTFDIKGSESLFLHGAKRGDSGKMVQICLSHFSTAILSNKGVIIQTKGDQITAFFPKGASSETPITLALRTLSMIAQDLPLVERNFHDQGLLPVRMDISFRAGLAKGNLRPTWEKLGDHRFAAWTEQGETHPMKDAEVLKDLEKQLESHKTNISTVVLEESLAQEHFTQEGNDRQWFVRNHSITDRKGQRRVIAAFGLTVANEEELPKGKFAYPQQKS